MTAPRLNVLFLCTDQQRFDALHAAGNDDIQTPNLDRLVEEGTLFETCYVQNPVCGPSRASLMTGQYVSAHGLHANGVDIAPQTALFSRWLADAGYDCSLVGKFHLGACEQGRLEPRVDDGFQAFRWAHDPYPGSPENAYHRWVRGRSPETYAALSGKGPAPWDTIPTELHYSHWVAEETIDLVERAAGADEPFFVVANFFDPHHGFGAPAEYRQRYDTATLAGPRTVAGELDSKPPIQAEASKRSYAGHAKGFVEYDAAELLEVRANYYAMVTLVDDEVGRILDALERTGQADSTVVVFTSDHGEMLGDHQLMLKGPFMYECAVRVPLIVRWPGRGTPGRRVSEPVQWVDLAPTVLEAAGVPAPAQLQGRSLTALLDGPDPAWREWALCQYRDSGHPYDPPVHVSMLRRGDWKLVVHHGPPATARERSGELYDLQADPAELVNRWDDPDAADTRVELERLLLDVLVGAEDRSNPRRANW